MDESARESLEELFAELFSSVELRHLAHGLPNGSKIAAELPGREASDAQVRFTLVDQMIKNNIVAEALTIAGRRRPHRREEIDRVAAQLGLEFPDPPSSDTLSSSISRSRRRTVLASLAVILVVSAAAIFYMLVFSKQACRFTFPNDYIIKPGGLFEYTCKVQGSQNYDFYASGRIMATKGEEWKGRLYLRVCYFHDDDRCLDPNPGSYTNFTEMPAKGESRVSLRDHFEFKQEQEIKVKLENASSNPIVIGHDFELRSK